MRRTPLLLLIGAIGLVVIGGIAWWLIAPVFVNDVVDESFPTAAEVAAMPENERIAAQVEAEATAALMADVEMDEPMPSMPPADSDLGDADSADSEAPASEDEAMEEAAASEPIILSQGEFVDADSFHQGSGTATIYQLPDGSRVLRLEGFEVTNGPDLHVILVANPEPTSRDNLGDYVDLGELKGNVGNQNYDIPADVDLSVYGSIVIYCQPFHVVFSTASLVSG